MLQRKFAVAIPHRWFARVVAGGLILFGTGFAVRTAEAQDWGGADERSTSTYDRPVAINDYAHIPYAEHTGWGARLGLGFVADPSSFLVDMAVPYNTGRGVSVGPRLQLGLSEDTTYIAPTLSIEYAHDLRNQFNGPLGKIRPLVQAGLGFVYLEKDGRRGKNDDVDFLFDIGVGVEYPLTEGFAIASVFDFNILPRKTLDETLIFTWQVLQLRVQF